MSNSPTPVFTAPSKDNPKLGVTYMIIMGIFFASAYLCAKFLYESHPDLTPSQLLTYRGIITSLLMLIWLNRNYKVILWDSLRTEEGKAQIKGLMVRVI